MRAVLLTILLALASSAFGGGQTHQPSLGWNGGAQGIWDGKDGSGRDWAGKNNLLAATTNPVTYSSTAITFSGSCLSNSTVGLISSTEPFTYLFWIKSSLGGVGVAGLGSAASSGEKVLSAGTTLYFQLRYNGSIYSQITRANVGNNAWRFCVLDWSGKDTGTMTMHVDGVETTANFATNITYSGQTLLIGREGGTGPLLSGSIAGFRRFNRVLTLQEKQRYRDLTRPR